MTAESPERTAADGLRSATRGSALNMLGAVVTTIAGFASLIVVSRSYGQIATGVLFTAVGVFTLLANTAKLGTESSMTWFVARARASDRRGAIEGVIRSALRASVIASVAIGLLTALLAAATAPVLTDDPESLENMEKLLVVLAISIPPWAIAQASLGAMRGFGTMKSSVWVGSVIRPGVQLVVLAALVLVDVDLWMLGFAWSAAAIASAVAGLWWLWHRLAPLDTKGSDDGRAEFWAHARPRAASDVLHGALERLDLILVGALAGSAAAGSYAAANRLVLAGQLLLLAIAQAIAPQVAARLAQERLDEAEIVVQRVTGWSVMVIWPFLAVLVLGAPGIVSVFGEDFAGAADVVIVLGVGLALVAAVGPGDAVLLMTGDSRGSMHNHLLSLATMVIVAFATIPSWGAIGAALAWVCSRLVLRGLSVWRIRRATGIRSLGPEVFIAMALTVTAYLPLGLALIVAGVGDLAVLVTVAMLGSAAYAAGLWQLRTRLAIPDLVASIR